MSEAAEIPEAKDPFEKSIAITIAVLAVILSFVNIKGDNAKTESILRTNEATNKWGYYQSKSIKHHVVEAESELLAALSAQNPTAITDAAAIHERLAKNLERYDKEKEEIKATAEKLEHEAKEDGEINDRCDFGALFLQLGIVIASVAILTRWRLLWIISILLGLTGTVVGLSAYLIGSPYDLVELISHLKK